MITLVAPVQDTVARSSDALLATSVGVLFLVFVGGFFVFAGGSLLLNRILKDTPGYCDQVESNSWLPVAQLACFICILIQFFKPRTWKAFHERGKKKRARKTEERQKKEKELFDARQKQKTFGLTDI